MRLAIFIMSGSVDVGYLKGADRSRRGNEMSQILGDEALIGYSSLASVWMHYQDESRPDWIEEYRPVVELGVAYVLYNCQLYLTLVDQEQISRLRLLWSIKYGVVGLKLIGD